jgi:hypothetical protein
MLSRKKAFTAFLSLARVKPHFAQLAGIVLPHAAVSSSIKSDTWPL